MFIAPQIETGARHLLQCQNPFVLENVEQLTPLQLIGPADTQNMQIDLFCTGGQTAFQGIECWGLPPWSEVFEYTFWALAQRILLCQRLFGLSESFPDPPLEAGRTEHIFFFT